MKNKGLLGTIVGLMAVLLFGFFYERKNEDPKAGQENEQQYKIGLLQFVSHPALDEITEGVKAGLKERGMIEDQNLTLLFQNGQADQSKLTTMSQQLITKGAEVLIGIATPAVQSLANETKDIPVILGAVTDPVGAGLIQDMENPGGNLTGVSDKAPVLEQLKLAQTLLPTAKKIGILFSSAEDNSKYQVAEAEKAAESLGLSVEKFAVPSTNEIRQIVQVMSEKVDFIYIPLDNTIANAMPSVVSEANKTKTPIIPSVDTMVAEGGLATVSINQFEIGYQVGLMAASIAKGEKETATTPVYTFDEGEIIINEEQAALLQIDIPQTLKETAKQIGGEAQ
ncbi:tryptophan ABC transporter substrate-binding protein [Enterococcus sp. LJL98]